MRENPSSGMLKRTKYSRLRNDSLSSLDDRPHTAPPLKRELPSDSDFARLDPGWMPPAQHPQQAASTLRDFIPRMANFRPFPLPGLRAQRGGEEGPHHRICSQPSLSVSSSGGHSLNHLALRCAKRPITLHRIASLPWTLGCSLPCSQQQQHGDEEGCCLSSAADDCPVVGTTNRAVHHDIKYMGSVEVTHSMRNLDFETRMQVTREAISRLCERTSANTTTKNKRCVYKGACAVLGQMNLQFCGCRIIVTVSTDAVTLITSSSLQKIAHHPMQAISFASGGDPDVIDYIAYVAKDVNNQRACHILECPRGRACDIINSIGQAFDTRFRQLLHHTPALLSSAHRSPVRICHDCSTEVMLTEQQAAEQEVEVNELSDYYNVTPGKMPPAGGMEDLRITTEEDMQEVCLPRPASQYENCSITEETVAPPTEGWEDCGGHGSLLIQDLIQEEGWFHGRLGRKQAESLLTCSGDFLVRESSSASGQYVLSGMEGATARHLLLIDPHGQVRTRDRVFVSVGHLVRFHMENGTPIVFGSSELSLRQPVLHRH